MMAAMMVQRKGKEKKKKEINLQNRSAEPRQKKNFLMTQSVRIDAADAFLQLAVREIWTLLLFFFPLSYFTQTETVNRYIYF